MVSMDVPRAVASSPVVPRSARVCVSAGSSIASRYQGQSWIIEASLRPVLWKSGTVQACVEVRV